MTQTDAVRRLPAALLAGALLLPACSSAPTRLARPAPPPAAAATPSELPPASLAWRGCGGGFDCATLPVPLVEDEPAGETVDLAVVRRKATGSRLGSLVVNPGGPGASAVGYLRAAWSSVPERVRERFDLVAVDPRGVGQSAPVRCADTAGLDAYFALDPTPDDAEELAAYERGNAALARACGERNADLLPHLSTRVAAGDLDRLRASLGDARLTYLGYSYGTSIGAQYLDRFPTRVRAMVLDGALDPTLSWDALLEGQSRGFDAALEAFLEDCERTRCSFRRDVEGDLLAAFDRLSASVDAMPLTAARPVGEGEFALGVLAALYSEDSWPVLSDALVQAGSGKGAGLLALADSYLERTEQGYSNVSEANLAVNCIDRPWPRESRPFLALAERVAADSPRFGPAIALSGLACASWPVPPTAEPRAVTAPGSPPVLVVGTTGDPATPYAWSQALAGQLSRGVLLTYEGEGHTVYRVGAPGCVLDVVDTYLLTARAPAPRRC